jgi:predicted CXXCH cytochrome family protein
MKVTRSRIWKIAGVLLVVVPLVLALSGTALGAGAGEGVTQVSVSVSAAEINPNGTTDITVTVLTGKATDAWTGTLEVTEQDGDVGEISGGISGTGTGTVTKTYPSDFSLKSGTGLATDTTGTYDIDATANITDQSALSGAGSFDVKDYIISASPTRIAKGATTTLSITTNEATWSGTITVTEPNAETSTASVSQADPDAVYPDDFAGTTPSTAAAGVYTAALSGAGTDSTTFDVQDANPHAGGTGGFGTTTDACAGCHRAHTASGPKLLTESTQTDFCNSCHDGSGANTDTVNGQYLGSTEGTEDAGLRGGGFTNAIMDTDLTGGPSSDSVTSKHTVGVLGTTFGSGDINASADAGENVTLECTNCHNPHGNAYYRNLRPKPTAITGWDALTAVNVPDETSTNYTISYDDSSYRDLGQYPTAVLALMSDWCGQCHTRYHAAAGAGNTDSGDALFAYRHMTDSLGGECLKCHVVHGTSATMGSYSSTVPWPSDGDSIDGEASRSSLLHIDSRGVCIQCHTSDWLASN